MNCEFTPIDFAAWERTEYYEYYKKLIKTRYNLTVRLDVTALRERLRQKGLKFYPAMVWCIAKAVNSHKQFRTAYQDGQLGYYTVCHPAYTVLHRDTGTFSDLWTEYSEDFAAFYRAMTADLKQYGEVHRIKGKPDCPPNFISISCVPWMDFTGFGCDTYSESSMYFPVILFGKFTEENGKVTLPFSIWEDHAVADGWHIHLLLQTLQQLLDEPEKWIQ